MTGHTVLAVGVPDLDDWVRTRTAQYDASFVSADPAFRHAHITLLAPWIANPVPSSASAMAEHSMCQPGLPSPHGESQAVSSPSLRAFQSDWSSPPSGEPR